jgi:hypothetical protein
MAWTVDRIKLEIWNGSTYADLTDLIYYNVEELNGLGSPPVRNLTQRGPLQDGVTFLDYRLDELPIQLVLTGLGTDENSWHSRRDEFVNIFRPSSSLLQLRYSVPPDRVRQWDVYVSIPPRFNTTQRIGMNQRTVVELRSPDPTAYDPEGVGVPFAVSGGSSEWVFPWVLPTFFGTSTLSMTQVISMSAVNAAKSYPIITIQGPINTPVITNNATGDKLQFTTNLGALDVYTIDCRYGYKSIINQSGASKTGDLSDDSDLTTFSLQPGDNSISVTGSSITAATQVSFQYFNRYLGV